MERNIKVKAVVTGSRNFGELNRSVNLLTQDNGLINAIIFGGRKGSKASLAPLFSCGEFRLYHNTVRDEYSLTDEALELTPVQINSDISAVYTASYFCEVLNSTCTDQTEFEYGLLANAMKALEKDPASHRKILIDFTWQILSYSGVVSDLEECPSCEKQYNEGEILGFSYSMITPVCKNCADNENIILMPGSRRYLTYTRNMSFEDALKVQLYPTAQERLVSFLTKWITAFCQKPLFTVKSGLL